MSNLELLLQPITEQAIEGCLTSNSHALMLVGPSGSGKLTVAEYIAGKLLNISNLINNAGYKVITPEKNSIGIDEIRKVQHFLRLKTTGKSRIRRVVVAADAHLMTIEAQNAFLKLLEEPPEDTLIVLTVSSLDTMLPTVYSRVQTIVIQPPAKVALVNYFQAKGCTSPMIEKAYLLSGGLVGLMTALLNNEDEHPLLTYVEKAKQFLSYTSFQRLAALDTFAKNREELNFLIEALKRMSSTAFEQAALQNKTAQSAHWHKIRCAVLSSEKLLANSPNVKLLLTDLSLNL